MHTVRWIERIAPARNRLGVAGSAAALLTMAGLPGGPLVATTSASAASMRVSDSAHLRLVGSRENTLFETGSARGTLPGRVQVRFTLNGTRATSRFTIHARGGAIYGIAQGRVKSGKSGYDSFGGRLKITGGSGRFKHAHGSGGLYGTLYKFDESIRVHVKGALAHR